MHSETFDDEVTIEAAPAESLDDLLPLWTEVFTQPPGVFTGVWASCPPERRHTFVARAGGRPVACVQLYVLLVRDERGAVELVGCLANVSTRPEYRNRGLARQLAQAAIGRMEEVGCGWSYLFTGVPEFYARLGWREYERPAVEFDAADLRIPSAARRLVADDLPQVRVLHERHHGQTPLSLVRNEADWETKIPPRFDRQLAWGVGYPLTGYLSANLDGETLSVNEWAASTSDEYASLLAAAAGREGVQKVVVAAPVTDASRPVLASGRTISMSVGMARPIDSRWTYERLGALLGDPQSRFFPLDNF